MGETKHLNLSVAERIVGTNPFSFGIKINKKNLIVDFATSLLAEGKINLARLNKEKIKVKPIISKKEFIRIIHWSFILEVH